MHDITKPQFNEYKLHFDNAMNHCHELLANEHFDTVEYERLVDNVRVDITMQFTNRLNELFNTKFIGTEAFFETFGSLHEIDYDSLCFTVALYKYMS